MRFHVFGALFITTALLAVAHCFPGVSRESTESIEDADKKNVDTVLVLPGSNPFARPIRPVFGLPDLDEDDLEGFSSPGYLNPFGTSSINSFLTSMQSAMNRLREQMAAVFATRAALGGFFPWNKIPEGANTTSTTKVIDGHVVTVNETTFTDGDDDMQTIFRVRVIDVKPEFPDGNGNEPDAEAIPVTTESNETREETTAPPRSIETLEDSDNEIPKSQVDTLTA